MPIEMPRGLPFSVDTWTAVSKRKRHHFLTHAHKDHCNGILTHSSFPIYSTPLTKSLVLHHYPQLDDSLFVGIEVGQSVIVDDPDGQFTVTAFDANHCPGAVMFLFEGSFGNILHTGDCRLSPEYLRLLPEKYISQTGKKPRSQLDYVFLDCTFGRFQQKLPSKHSAIQQVINCIWKHPAAAVVYLTCDLLGQEDILAQVSQTFGSKIFVDKACNPEFLALTVTVPEIITQDPSSRFRLLDGFPKLNERVAAKLAEARSNFQPDPLIVRPSAQWYACEEEHSDSQNPKTLRFNEAVRDQFGIWHVCYSMHSSREELEWALQLLVPKWVVSTTPSCRAIELDYVKRHCFSAQLTSKDPLWKLLDIRVEASSEADVSVVDLVDSPVVERPAHVSPESQLQPVKVSCCRLLSLSPPRKRPALTLFGKARLGNRDTGFAPEEKVMPIKDESPQEVCDNINQELPCEDTGQCVKCENKLGNKPEMNFDAENCKAKTMTEVHKLSSCSLVGSSKSFSESLKKLYRSMNVPVPRPLPPLVELMGANKPTKRRFGLQS